MSTQRNQTTLRITIEMDKRLTDLSKQMGVSKNAYIMMVLSKEVKNAV